MTIFIIDFGCFTVRVPKRTIEEAIQYAKEKFPHRKIVDISIQ